MPKFVREEPYKRLSDVPDHEGNYDYEDREGNVWHHPGGCCHANDHITEESRAGYEEELTEEEYKTLKKVVERHEERYGYKDTPINRRKIKGSHIYAEEQHEDVHDVVHGVFEEG